jgi:uncharacterized protein (DUF2141 family)
MYFILIKSIFLSIFFPFKTHNTGKLVLNINNIEKGNGTIYVAIYNSSGTFLNEKKYAYKGEVNIKNNTPTTSLAFTLPLGTYAATCFQDINGNKLLDENTFGIPQEPYGLSNNVPGKWRKPTFTEAKIDILSPEKTINIELKRWKDR